MAVKLSASRAGGIFLSATLFCQSHSAAGRMKAILKSAVTLFGFEPSVFRLVAEGLNQLRHREPRNA
jgi:hypothetical protein